MIWILIIFLGCAEMECRTELYFMDKPNLPASEQCHEAADKALDIVDRNDIYAIACRPFQKVRT
jgi:hypothetical protein